MVEAGWESNISGIHVGICISDHQKLEREARICRLLKHPNIGEPWECEGALVHSGEQPLSSLGMEAV